MRNLSVSIFYTLLVLLNSSCGVEEKSEPELANTTRYYESFKTTNKGLPFLPIYETPKQKALLLPSYIEAEYDSSGNLSEMKKFVKGNISFTQTITYNTDGSIKAAVLKDSEGNITMQKTF